MSFCKAEVHVGDVGTVFEVTLTDQDCTPEDVSPATTIEFIFKKPDGTTLTVAGAFVNTGSDGKVSYTTVAGNVDQSGPWYLQIRLVFPSGEFRSNIGSFEVYDNLS